MTAIPAQDAATGSFRIGLLEIGPGLRPAVIAEVAQAHDGSLGQAHAFIDAIADAGADAVKFQTHIAAAESTGAEPWRVAFSRQDATRYDYWRRMEFTPAQWQGLAEHATQRGLLFLSSPFSPAAFELLDRIGMPAWKIASGEIANLPLIRQAAATGRPVLLSSGMSDYAELDAAVATCRSAGAPLAVFQCSTVYPCPPERVGLNVMLDLQRRYASPVGLSDHSGRVFAGLAAAALGASLIEVHVTFSRQMFGPDVSSSLTFPELAELVNGVRDIHRMRTIPVDKEQAARELDSVRRVFLKSVVALRSLPAGAVLGAGDLGLKKAGGGLPPHRLETLLGRRLVRAVAENAALQEEDLAP